MPLPRRHLLALAPGLLACRPAQAQPAQAQSIDPVDHAIRSMLEADSPADIARLAAPLAVAGERQAVPALIHLLYWLDPDRHPPIAEALAAITGVSHGADWMAWMNWLQLNPDVHAHPGFPRLLADLLSGLDSRYASLLPPDAPATIRREELVWASLTLDGAAPLDHPPLEPAVTADWLADSDTVLAARIGGIPRAWPLRILAWHPIVNDTIGRLSITLAAFPLAGTAILYATDRRAKPPLTFGTTGLLHRSTELIHDRETGSLWNHLTGRPVLGPAVLGPLADAESSLVPLPLTTTTWGEWRAAHPETTVLSRDPARRHDDASIPPLAGYATASALYFPAALPDDRLPAKSRVFAVRWGIAARAWPLARFAGGALLHDRLADTHIIVLGNGAAEDLRAYRGAAPTLRRAVDGTLADDSGRWTLAEDVLTGPAGQILPRLPGLTAYWFAWSNAFPGTLADT